MKKSVSCVGLVMVVLVSALSPACKKPAGPAGHSDHAAPAAGAPTPAPAAHAAHLPPGYAAVEVDQARQQLLGMKTLVVRRQPFERLIRTVGIVQTDETRTAHVHVKFDGFIEKIYVNFTGKQVKKGQPLLRIFSRDLLAAEQEYLASRAALGRTQGASAEAGRSAAQQLVGASRERLRLFDIPESVLQKIERTGVAERA
ncbi:MAG TPA: efflux RND transporter periplasmic adaptor subunit, partial [Polyangia bacterium]